MIINTHTQSLDVWKPTFISYFGGGEVICDWGQRKEKWENSLPWCERTNVEALILG